MIIFGSNSKKARMGNSLTLKILTSFFVIILILISFTPSVFSAITVEINDGTSTDETTARDTPTVEESVKNETPVDESAGDTETIENTPVDTTEDITTVETAEDTTPVDTTEENTVVETTTTDTPTIEETSLDTTDYVTTIKDTTNNDKTSTDNISVDKITKETVLEESTIINSDNNSKNLTENLDYLNNILNGDINSSDNIKLYTEGIEFEYQNEEEIGDIITGEEVEVFIGSQEIDDPYIDSIEFTSTNDFKDVKLTVTTLIEKPQEVEKPLLEDDKSIYGYVDIKLTTNDKYIEEMPTYINFNVEKKWIEENNLDENSILLIRYHEGEWQELETQLITSDNISIYYKAITPGFSTFAVVGSSLVKIDDTYTSNNLPEIPIEIMILLIAGILILLVVILFKSRYIYFKEEKQHKSKKIKP